MAEPTIASAVAIPESDEPPQSSPTATLKRRQSSASVPDSKRPRLSTDANATSQDDASEPPSATSPTRPPDRRRSGIADDRARNKRMFGGLVGHLTQASPSNAQKQRGEIERKQQAKLKLQAEEREEEKRKKREELLVVRRREQRIYDKQAMRTRHANLLNMAQFLKTKSDPVLFYKPWDLLPSEEERIKSQVEEAQATIDRELKDFADRMGPDEETATQDQPRQSPDKEEHSGDGTEDASKNPDTVGSHTNDTATAPLKSDSANSHSVPASETVHTQSEPAKGNDDDHGGEVMVEDKEDTVIY